MDKDSKGQRKMEDSGGGLLTAVEGHSLEQKRIIEYECQDLLSPHNGMYMCTD